MTEVMTLHREMNGEEGELCCVRYTLTAERCGRERLYGMLCCVEGLPPQAERCKQIPAWLEDRRVGELLLEYWQSGMLPRLNWKTYCTSCCRKYRNKKGNACRMVGVLFHP